VTTTMNHDEEIPVVTPESWDNYNIIYGQSGWTDEVDDATVDLLVNAGAIRLHQLYRGVYNRTRVYVSVKGTEPN
jgi:hypothetical protein